MGRRLFISRHPFFGIGDKNVFPLFGKIPFTDTERKMWHNGPAVKTEIDCTPRFVYHRCRMPWCRECSASAERFRVH